MPSEDTKTLEFNQYWKFHKTSFIIYADLQCLIKKFHRCKSSPKKSITSKESDHTPSEFFHVYNIVI